MSSGTWLILRSRSSRLHDDSSGCLSSAAFRLLTYAWWCLPWWICIVCASICGSSAAKSYGSGGSEWRWACALGACWGLSCCVIGVSSFVCTIGTPLGRAWFPRASACFPLCVPYLDSAVGDSSAHPLTGGARWRSSPKTALSFSCGGCTSSPASRGSACCTTSTSCRGRSSRRRTPPPRSEEHTSELQSPCNLVCRLLLEKK